MLTKNDPENYAKMSEPYESLEVANKELEKFFDELSEIRKKYKVSDVLIVVKGSMKNADGSIGGYMTNATFGNDLNAESMAAFAYGRTRAEREERISKFISGK